MNKIQIIPKVLTITALLFVFSLLINSLNTPTVSASAQTSCAALFPPKSSTAGRNGCLKGYAAGKAGQSNADSFCRAQYPPKSSTAGRNGCLQGYAAGKAAGGGGGGGGSGTGSGGGGGSGTGSGSSSDPGGGDPGAGAGARPDSGPNFPSLECEGGDCSDPAADPSASCDRGGCDIVKKYVNPAVKALSAMVGIIAVISLIVGGIQYSASGGDPQKVTSAKDRISKTIIAFVAYVFLAAFLEFLVPGGIFR